MVVAYIQNIIPITNFIKRYITKKISYHKSYKDDFHVSLNPTLPYLSKDKITEKQKIYYSA